MRNAAVPLPLVCTLALTAALAACTAQSDYDRLDDEAMKRARYQNKKPADAAREWYYPKRIDNYFAGMDTVVVLAGAPLDDPTLALHVPVYQLPDKPDVVAKHATVQRIDPIRTYDEILGRNTWMLWAGGNEGFWDWLSRQFGFIDLLKLVDSRQRSARFRDGGLINEPGMQQASAPDELGLWLDVPVDPEVRAWRREYLRRSFGMYPAATGGSYGMSSTGPTQESMTAYRSADDYDKRIPPPEIYGISSGVVGLRLFPNPNFNEAARKRWDADKYYGNAAGDPNIVRPYRVGMSCGFCHASYHPLDPPRDLVNPQWRNISGNIGAQYLRPRMAFGNLLPKENLIYHILDSQPPGTIDTSLIASDNINNPNTMNAVFNLPQRAVVSMLNPKESLTGASTLLPSIWAGSAEDPQGPPVVPEAWRKAFEQLKLAQELQGSNDALRRVPRILLDGADSIGAYGALARVYLNIGTNYEQWNTLHEPVVGFFPQKPFTIDGVRQHSVYWHATQLRVGPLRDYFLKVTPPMPLLAAGADPGDGARAAALPPPPAPAPAAASSARPQIDPEKVKKGRNVFARNCIVCHSSIQPAERHAEMQQFARVGELWDHDPGRWLSDAKYIAWADAAVEQEDFWRFNYLSTDYRVPVNLVGTNPCRALATNAIAGNMWEDYSSTSYKTLPSAGTMTFFNPYLGERGGEATFVPQHRTPAGAPRGGGGPGFYRVPTLVSIWATAPFLHNNSLGLFNNDPSIEGRLKAFDDGIRKLLWPSRRTMSSSYNDATASRLKADRGLIWRTDTDTYLTIPGIYLPQILGARLMFLRYLSDRYPILTTLPPWLRPLPTAALLLIAFFLLWVATNRWLRYAGYLAIVLALVVGGLIYFYAGTLGGLRLGPIPPGTPVSLLANANPDAERTAVKRTLATVSKALLEIQSTKATPGEIDHIMRTRVAPALMEISKCPDLVMDRGHYFRWFERMTDEDKENLIELLKTF